MRQLPVSRCRARWGPLVALATGAAVLGIGVDRTSTGGAATAGTLRAEGAGMWSMTTNVIAEDAKLGASDGSEGDVFGYRVAIDADTIAVSAPELARVYVFARDGSEWVEHTRLDAIGPDVALSGDTLVAGKVLFERSGDTWGPPATLAPEPAAAFDGYGDVAIDGNTIAVGAPGDDERGNDAGAVYVFHRDADGWRQQHKLTSPHPAANAWFGHGVAIDGDLMVIGQPYHWGYEPVEGGVAYVYRRVAGTWSYEARLRPDSESPIGRFGATVAGSGKTVAVGAGPYVFTHDGTEWSQQARLVASDLEIDAAGGYVAVDGDWLVTGGAEHHHDGVTYGSAYAFYRMGSRWYEVGELVPTDAPSPLGAFTYGASVALSGNTAVVGVEHDIIDPPGEAYVFTLVPPVDSDGDGVPDIADNCSETANPEQRDRDDDGIGDVCDSDRDGDDVTNDDDNCPDSPNAEQHDLDDDGIGDACDGDGDGDDVPDMEDNCPGAANADQRDLDGDGVGDVCDADADGDDVPNVGDNCPGTANADQLDGDGDGVGDACDAGCEDCDAEGCGCEASHGAGAADLAIWLVLGLALALGRRRRARR